MNNTSYTPEFVMIKAPPSSSVSERWKNSGLVLMSSLDHFMQSFAFNVGS